MQIQRASTSIKNFKLLAAVFFAVVMSFSHAQEPGMGHLFSTPEERILLESMRQRGEQMTPEEILVGESLLESLLNAVENTTRTPPPDNLELRIGGSVLRRNGDNTLWINGLPVTQQDLPEGMRIVQHRHLLALQISQGGQQVLLLPGQRLHMASRTISNMALQGGPSITTPVTSAQTEELRNTLDQVMEFIQ